ncbi:MAG: Flp family type IVb pilin [Sphingomicrobium sp.]
MVRFLRLLRDQRGATAIEYALVAGLISIAAVAAFQSVGSSLTNTFSNVSTKLG